MNILKKQPVKSIIYGRAFFADDDDEILDIDVFEYEIEPMEIGKRGGQAWFLEFLENATDKRALLGAPEREACQVLFKGTIFGRRIRSFEGDEWEDEFECNESSWVHLPKEFEEALKGNPQ